MPFPCYSSSLNPSEVLFNQIKYDSRTKVTKVKSMNLGKLQQAIDEVVAHKVKKEDISFAFKQVEEYAERY